MFRVSWFSLPCVEVHSINLPGAYFFPSTLSSGFFIFFDPRLALIYSNGLTYGRTIFFQIIAKKHLTDFLVCAWHFTLTFFQFSPIHSPWHCGRIMPGRCAIILTQRNPSGLFIDNWATENWQLIFSINWVENQYQSNWFSFSAVFIINWEWFSVDLIFILNWFDFHSQLKIAINPKVWSHPGTGRVTRKGRITLKPIY